MSVSSSTPADIFAAAYESLAGQPHRVNRDKGADAIFGIIREAKAGRIAIAGLPDDLTDAVTKLCEDAGIEVLRAPFQGEDIPARVDSCDIGITLAACAIAETGTLVETFTDDADRLVSSLPYTHIGVVNAADIVPAYYDVAPRLKELFSAHAKNCVVSFVSGPSRTGDIEMRLIHGVHGPGIAHAVILGDSA